jgi:CRP-like cAMP-binding protein
VKAVHDLFRDWDETVSMAAGTEILSEDVPVDNLFVILDGEVELSLHGQALGRETVGGIIGEMAVIASTSGNPTVRAVSEVKLARLGRDQFKRLIASNPAFAHHALEAMANRLRAVNEFISAKLEPRE